MSEITRRKFFFFGLAVGVRLLLPDKKIEFKLDKPWIYKPTAKQIEFFNTPPNVHMSLYGIPYHQDNAFVSNTYYGISREFLPK